MQKIRKDVQLGKNIRALRLATRMTQEEVTARLQLSGCDISRSIYSQIENGTYNIRISELVALKHIFQVDYNTLFAEIEKISPDES